MNIAIQETQLPAVEYQGLRVVTFAMVDKAHKRPKGTAKKAFSRNKERFQQGKDYFLAPASQKSTLRTFGINVPNRGLTLLTERGYLLLVKPLDDDLSWQVQTQMVDTYFRRPEIMDLRHIALPSLAELAAMPPQDAMNSFSRAEKQSRTLHGQQGSAGMTLRKKELKSLRPAERLVTEMIQIDLADTGDYADE